MFTARNFDVNKAESMFRNVSIHLYSESLTTSSKFWEIHTKHGGGGGNNRCKDQSYDKHEMLIDNE